MSDELPQGWAECEMGDVAKVIGGGTPDSQDLENFSTETGIPWLTPADLSDNKAIHVARGKRFLTKKGFDNSSARLVPKGTVLFSSRAPIGYVAVAENEISTNQGFKSFVCADGISSEYIYFWLRFATPVAEELASGTTFAEISGKNAARIPLRLAPLAEQRRIVAKLEKLLGKVDACQQRLAKIPVLLKRFRQSILAAACSGRLTADWREENPKPEPARKIIEGLETESGRDSAEVDAAELPFAPPDSWECIQAQDVCRTAQIITYGVLKPVWVKEGVPTVRVQDMQRGKIAVEAVGECSPERAKKFAKTTLQAGDLLIAKDGATLGKTAFVPPELAGGNITQHVLRFPISRLVEAVFVRMVIDSQHGQDWMRLETKGVALPGVNVGDFRRMPIPLPPLAEQQEIVRRVEGLFALADQIESRFAQARAQVDQLTLSLLAKAFRGELVPQDPTDEPATELLERIRQKG